MLLRFSVSLILTWYCLTCVSDRHSQRQNSQKFCRKFGFRKSEIGMAEWQPASQSDSASASNPQFKPKIPAASAEKTVRQPHGTSMGNHVGAGRRLWAGCGQEEQAGW
ncbi:unnamed protein product [Sphagnum tenellum]